MELLDIYDSKGKLTGKTIERGGDLSKLKEDEHIAVGVIFIENDKGEYLIQKTSKEKGGQFSSTGGHIDSSETPLSSIKREIEEELGIIVNENEIKEYGYLLYDMPLRFLFYIKKNIDLKDVKVQKEEVDYVEYMSVEKIKELIKTNQMLKSHAIMFEELLKKKKEK